MLADADVNGVWVINKNALHLFDHDFNLKGRWFYSEQFDRDGVDWSVFHMSHLPEIHNPFAVFARLAMGSGIERGQSDEDYEKFLQKKRWISTSRINLYQQQVERLPKRVRTQFWIEYDAFDRQHFPRWGKQPMTVHNGGREFREARRLMTCLYIAAGSPFQSVARALVLHISSAVDNLNDSEAQLYEPNCPH